MSTSILSTTQNVTIHDAGHHDHDATTVLGFWLYLMSDCLIFATLFATFGVLAANTAGGPGGRALFDLPYVLGETALLLTSSFTFGFSVLSAHEQHRGRTQAWLWITFVLGAAFIAMELHEFALLIHRGAGPDTSAFLSSYFVLVGTHGLHVMCGLLWIVTLIHQVGRFGLNSAMLRRLTCLSLFWHFLDLIWICVFTFVYLRAFL